jgi:hypothetical protein
VNILTRSTVAPGPPSPVRSLAIVKAEIAATDAALVEAGRQLALLYKRYPEDLPVRGAFRLSSSRPLRPEIVALHNKRRELLSSWAKLLDEFSKLKGDA